MLLHELLRRRRRGEHAKRSIIDITEDVLAHLRDLVHMSVLDRRALVGHQLSELRVRKLLSRKRSALLLSNLCIGHRDPEAGSGLPLLLSLWLLLLRGLVSGV